MITQKFVCLFILTLFIESTSLAQVCGSHPGWEKPGPSTPTMTVNQAIEYARNEMGYNIAKPDYESQCFKDSVFHVTDIASGNLILVMYVPETSIKDDDGRNIYARLQQLRKTPREQLIALSISYQTLKKETISLEDEIGISAYPPSAIHIDNRTTNDRMGYMLYVDIIGNCKKGWFPDVLFRNLLVKTIEYIPGRTDYSPATIYQAGDLKRALFSDQSLYDLMQATAETNAATCDESRDGRTGRKNWNEIILKLKFYRQQNL